MRKGERVDARFFEALKLLPRELRPLAASAAGGDDAAVEEIRLRAGRRPSLSVCGRERFFSEHLSEEAELRSVLELASGSSFHTAETAMREGYFTAQGGFRIGIGGTVIRQGEEVMGFRDLSSLCIRIGRAIPGVSKELLRQMGGPGRMPGTLILSPPGLGKTTLLRDFILQLSSSGITVALADERGEIASLREGIPQFDVGPCTDVIDGCRREKAVEMLLRSMRPQFIAVDEIANANDIRALRLARGRGVRLLATLHGSGEEDLKTRPFMAKLFRGGVFEALILIRMEGRRRRYILRRGSEAIL